MKLKLFFPLSEKAASSMNDRLNSLQQENIHLQRYTHGLLSLVDFHLTIHASTGRVKVLLQELISF